MPSRRYWCWRSSSRSSSRWVNARVTTNPSTSVAPTKSRATTPKWYDDFVAQARATFGKCGIDLGDEFVVNERLPDDTLFTDIAKRTLVGISSQKQDRDSRKFPLHVARDFYSTHARHGEIQQHQVNLGVLIEQIESGAPAAHLQHDIANLFQDRGRDFPYRAVIVDKQDNRAGSLELGQLRSERRAFQNGVLDSAGQIELDRCSFSDAGFNSHAATGLLGEARNLAQS